MRLRYDERVATCTLMSVPALPAVVSLAALIAYQGTAMAVGQARVKHKVLPPAMSGPEPFECALRVQQNTLEHLVFFLPVFWLTAFTGALAVVATWKVWRHHHPSTATP